MKKRKKISNIPWMQKVFYDLDKKDEEEKAESRGGGGGNKITIRFNKILNFFRRK